MAAQTWQTFPFGPAGDYFNGFGLAVSPAFAADRTLFATGFGSVRRSTDGGETWGEQSTFGPTYGIALSPAFAADRTAWVTYRLIEGPGDGTPESSVMRTQDAGAAWAPSGVGLPGFYEPFVRTLAVSPNFGADKSVFTALSGQLLGTPDHSLFRSYDGGVELGRPGAAARQSGRLRHGGDLRRRRGAARARGNGGRGVELRRPARTAAGEPRLRDRRGLAVPHHDLLGGLQHG